MSKTKGLTSVPRAHAKGFNALSVNGMVTLKLNVLPSWRNTSWDSQSPGLNLTIKVMDKMIIK